MAVRPPICTLPGVTASLALLLGLVFCSPVLAKAPTGEFAIFSRCPRFTVEVKSCILSQITGGEVRLGKMILPVVNTMTFQGGIIVTENPNENDNSYTFVDPLGGESLSRTHQPVPGGLAGLVRAQTLPKPLRDALQERINTGAAGVTATTELVGTPEVNIENYIEERGSAISLPARFKLENSFLGSACYIGSRANPVVFNLTDGTTNPPGPNKPISGAPGVLKINEQFTFFEFTKDMLVDNAFSAPVATGCGGFYSSLLDSVIDAKLGLPSPAGHNTTILTGALYDVNAAAVIESEQ